MAEYTSEDIEVLSDNEHVRKRTNLYLGNTQRAEYQIPIFGQEGEFSIQQVEFIPAVYKTVNEIVDNSLDEFQKLNGSVKRKTIKINCDPLTGEYNISDNGRGVPIDIHQSGKHTPEVVFGQLRAGRNFNDDEKESGVIGQNGVGSSCVNFCSEQFKVTVYRDHQRYTQTFKEGGTKISKPRITDIQNDRSGTQVQFKLDPTVFGDVQLPETLVQNRAIEVAFNNPDVYVEYNDLKYRYPKGFKNILDDISKTYPKMSYHQFTYKNDICDMTFYVVHNLIESPHEQMFTWVNSSLLFDGGLCNTQFINQFVSKISDQVQSQLKKLNCTIVKEDVAENLIIFAQLKLKNPQYDAQHKTRLTGPNLRKEIQSTLEGNQWKQFCRKNKQWLDDVVNSAYERHHAKANKKAISSLSKNLKKKIPNLIDATSKARKNCSIYLTEGFSAGAQIVEVRDPKFVATLPMTGKINNVWGVGPAEVVNMGKLIDMFTAIGLVPGKPADSKKLRYGKIVIATDADPDGSHITSLLVCLFYNFWPELFDPNNPVVYKLNAPLITAYGKKSFHYFNTKEEYEKVKSKYRSYTIRYNKGLGSLLLEDWKEILDNPKYLTPIVDDGKFKETLELHFGGDSEKRREWLQH